MPANKPEDFHKLFPQFMREGDLESVLALYEPNIVFSNPEGDVKCGKAAIREELITFADTNQIFKFNPKKVIQIEDLALVYNEWEMTSPRQMSGLAIELFRRQPDGTWLLLIGDPFTESRTYSALTAEKSHAH